MTLDQVSVHSWAFTCPAGARTLVNLLLRVSFQTPNSNPQNPFQALVSCFLLARECQTQGVHAETGGGARAGSRSRGADVRGVLPLLLRVRPRQDPGHDHDHDHVLPSYVRIRRPANFRGTYSSIAPLFLLLSSSSAASFSPQPWALHTPSPHRDRVLLCFYH